MSTRTTSNPQKTAIQLVTLEKLPPFHHLQTLENDKPLLKKWWFGKQPIKIGGWTSRGKHIWIFRGGNLELPGISFTHWGISPCFSTIHIQYTPPKTNMSLNKFKTGDTSHLQNPMGWLEFFPAFVPKRKVSFFFRRYLPRDPVVCCRRSGT